MVLAQLLAAPAAPTFDGDTALLGQLVSCEGLCTALYRDGGGKMTGGIGWNFDANGIPPWAVLGLYNQAVAAARHALDVDAPWWRGLDPVRQRALINFAFNVGEGGLKNWPHFLACMEARDWAGARSQLMSTPWWDEVGHRGPMLASMIMTGLDPALPGE